MKSIFVMAPVFLLNAAVWVAGIYVLTLIIRALRKYLGDRKPTEETVRVRQTLGETIKAHRMERGMSQEFVAEQIGVSRQAVSKWENGASDPSTANLLALAKLFGISPEELLRDAEKL